MKVKQVFEMQEHPYTDKQGAPRVFYSRGVVLSDGTDEMYCEILGDKAKFQVPAVGWQCCTTRSKVRSWTDTQGNQRLSTEIELVSVGGTLQ